MSVGGVTGLARTESPLAIVAAPELLPHTRPCPSDGDFPEIDCVRDTLATGVVAAAEDRAIRAAVGAERVLIADGTLDEETYLRALAKALGTSFETLEGVPRARCPLDDSRLIECAANGLLPLTSDDGIHILLAPRGTAARRIIQLVADDPSWSNRFRFTTGKRLEQFVLRCGATALIARARDRLKTGAPLFSAAVPDRLGLLSLIALSCALTLAMAAAPVATVLAAEALLAMMFVAWLGFRLSSIMLARPQRTVLAAVPDTALPVYTVIAALYREAASVDDLLRAIARLDYPREKLDVILAVEADDHHTRTAIDGCRPRVPIRVIAVPTAEPRTKPKALNAALCFARGSFVVVFDAEDRPEPDQLRRALQTFREGGEDLACVQARLCIDNADDSWLTRLFAAEYATHFDVFLDALVRFGAPLPLGGSSNHFYTDVLRKIGAWDPYNVTEDADLGMRLARHGYRTAMIDSTTYEEAPARLGAWLKQRTRWFKGWMQTWAVHMRRPHRLARELGPLGFVVFQLVVGGNVLAALVHPLFLAGVVIALLRGLRPGPADAAATALAAFCGLSAFIGYLTSAILGWVGLSRRGMLATSRALLLTPLNWLLLSLAAWRALYQFAVAPHLWEKTEHGLARSSWRADAVARSLVELERELRKLKEKTDRQPSANTIAWARPVAPRASKAHPCRTRAGLRRDRALAGGLTGFVCSGGEPPRSE